MKKAILVLSAVMLIVVGIWSYRTITTNIQIRNEMAAVENLAAFGEEQFFRNDFESYVKNLQGNGLSDLKIDMLFSYNYEDNYDRETKTLWLHGIIDKMTSDLIDNYYTTEYNGIEGKRLATFMDSIKDGYAEEYIYTSSMGETVIISIYEPKYDITIHTSLGRKYEYSFGYTNSVVAKIDGDWVYYVELNGPVSYSGNCKYSGCRSSAREGSYYCHIHSCCRDDCSNKKEPLIHCCNTHNCKEPSCGLHRYTAANSEYCNIHYLAHYDD